jgi:hypothetical protein
VRENLLESGKDNESEVALLLFEEQLDGEQADHAVFECERRWEGVSDRLSLFCQTMRDLCDPLRERWERGEGDRGG